jgi:hypothetical protein
VKKITKGDTPKREKNKKTRQPQKTRIKHLNVRFRLKSKREKRLIQLESNESSESFEAQRNQRAPVRDRGKEVAAVAKIQVQVALHHPHEADRKSLVRRESQKKRSPLLKG